MKKKIATALALATMTALTVSAPAFATHNPSACPQTAGPGHSEFAHHHILPAVPEEGHNPGVHKGFSLCLGVHE